MTPGDQPRIALLYADTGGGHRATAEAVEQAIHQLYAGMYHTEIINAINALPYPYDQAEKIYPRAIKQFRTGYELFWKATNNRRTTTASRFFLETAGRDRAREFLLQHPADLVVSCHPILNQAIPEALNDVAPNTPIVGVVSDPSTVHALFWSPRISQYTVPSHTAYLRAIENGVSPEHVTVTGQPVAPTFAARVSAARLQRTHAGSSPGKSVVLLMGGGDGMGHLVETVHALAHSNLPIQIVAVCGRNEDARTAIMAMRTNVPTKALGFCKNIPELMGAADMLVTKAGPGSICEGFVAGLPMLLYDAVPGQEEGNIDWVTDCGAGHWCPSPMLVLEHVRSWLAQPGAMRAVSQASLAQAQPDSALKIATVIINTLKAARRNTAVTAPLHLPGALAIGVASGNTTTVINC